MLRKFKFDYNLTITTGTLHEDLGTSIITSRSFLLRMRNALVQLLTENQNTF